MLSRIFRGRSVASSRAAKAGLVEVLEDRRLLSVTLISQGPGGVAAGLPGAGAVGGTQMAPAVSDNGQFVVFASDATNLVAGDDNGVADLFVRDRTTGETRLVSAAPDGSVGNGVSGDPGAFRTGYALSGNGRFVIFASDATDLVDGKTDSNNLPDYFIRDLQTNTTKLVTATPSGDYSTSVTFGGTSSKPAISDDGSIVVFTATYSDLDASVTDADGASDDVFIRDMASETTTQLSKVANGQTGGGSVGPNPTISSDGRYIAFTSNDKLLPGLDDLTFIQSQVWVYDRVGNTLVNASTGSDGTTYGNGASENPQISSNGRHVAFQSSASNLVDGFVQNNIGGAAEKDVFVRNLDATASILVSRAAGTANAGGNRTSNIPAISADGRYVAYTSESSNLVAGITDANGDDGDGDDVFFFDASTGETKLLSIAASGGATGDQPSVDLIGDNDETPLAMSADGRYVVFSSSATNLVASDENVLQELFVRDTTTNTTRRVYDGIALPGGADVLANGGAASISADGTAILFIGSGFGVVSTETNFANQIFLDNQEGSGGNPGGDPGNNPPPPEQGTLVPTVFATLPAAVVGGAKAKGASVAVNVTNAAETDYNGPVTITLFASQDSTLSTTDDAQLVTVTKKLKLASAQSKPVKIKLSQFPSVTDGNYQIIAQVSGEGIPAGTNASDDVVNIAAPFVDLAGAFTVSPTTLVKGKKARATINVTNSGNVDAKGTVPVQIAISTDPTGAGATTVATVNAKLAIKAGKSKALKLNFTVPAETASGTYYVVATLDSTNALAEKNEANNTVLSTTTATIA